MSRPLPRYLPDDGFERKLAKILLETGEQAPPRTSSTVTLAGDSRRLRGIPVATRGVSGVSPGSDPYAETQRRLDP